MSGQVASVKLVATMVVNDGPHLNTELRREVDILQETSRSPTRGIINAVLLSAPIWALLGLAVYLWA